MMMRRNWVLGLGWALVSVLLLGLPGQAQTPQVMLISMTDRIDVGLVPYTERVLRDAEAQGAEAVIIRIDTPGGRADAAIQLRDMLLSTPVRTVALVDTKAYSAGALIALACDRLYMTSGSVIGAATPVSLDGQKMSEKVVSAIRTLFRATAEHHGRPPAVAEAMVDADIAIPGLVEAGKLLTLTTQEALAWKVAEGWVETVQELMSTLGVSPEALRPVSKNWAEVVTQVITRSPVPVLLLVVGLLALWVEFLEPGIGLGGLIGVVCLALFFGGHHLVGLAGWEEALLLGGGLVFLALELFVIPGFGVAGVLGIIALGAGVYLSLLGNYPAPADVWGAALSVLAVAILVAIGLCLTVLAFSCTPFWSRLSLRAQLSSGGGESIVSEIIPPSCWLGAKGMTATPLMPSGSGVFLGKRLDIVSEGAYVPVDIPVEIVHVEGHRIVVRPIVLASS